MPPADSVTRAVFEGTGKICRDLCDQMLFWEGLKIPSLLDWSTTITTLQYFTFRQRRSSWQTRPASCVLRPTRTQTSWREGPPAHAVCTVPSITRATVTPTRCWLTLVLGKLSCSAPCRLTLWEASAAGCFEAPRRRAALRCSSLILTVASRCYSNRYSPHPRLL